MHLSGKIVLVMAIERLTQCAQRMRRGRRNNGTVMARKSGPQLVSHGGSSRCGPGIRNNVQIASKNNESFARERARELGGPDGVTTALGHNNLFFLRGHGASSVRTALSLFFAGPR